MGRQVGQVPAGCDLRPSPTRARPLPRRGARLTPLPRRRLPVGALGHLLQEVAVVVAVIVVLAVVVTPSYRSTGPSSTRGCCCCCGCHCGARCCCDLRVISGSASSAYRSSSSLSRTCSAPPRPLSRPRPTSRSSPRARRQAVVALAVVVPRRSSLLLLYSYFTLTLGRGVDPRGDRVFTLLLPYSYFTLTLLTTGRGVDPRGDRGGERMGGRDIFRHHRVRELRDGISRLYLGRISAVSRPRPPSPPPST